MSNWKEELKESVKPSTDWSKYNLSEMIDQAKKAHACGGDIEKLSKYSSIEEALKSKRASYWCCWYVVNILKSRWEEAEAIIMKDSWSSYAYASQVLKGRWKEAEPIIMKNAEYSYWYAKNILKGRWKEAESVIMKESWLAYLYARDVLKGRWQEAESIIMKDALYAYAYATQVIKGRWLEAEPFIMKNSYCKVDYENYFNCKLGEES